MVLFLSLLMAATMWAKGANNGTSKNDAYEFDWKTQNLVTRTGEEVWYHVDMEPAYKLDQPFLALKLKNTTAETVDVTINAEIQGETQTRSYTLASGGIQTWSLSAAMVVNMKIHEIYLTITTTKSVSVEASLKESEDINDACMKAVAFVEAGQNLSRGATRWYAWTKPAFGTNEVYVFTYENTGTKEAKVNRQLSPVCPVSSGSQKTMKIAVGATYRDTLNKAMLSLIDDEAYLQVGTTQNITIRGEKITIATGSSIDLCYSSTLAPDTWTPISKGASVYNNYNVALKDLLERRHQPQLCFSNEQNATDATVTVDFIFGGSCSSNAYTTHVVEIPAGEIGTLDIAADIVAAIDTNTVANVYARVHTAYANIQGMWRMKHLREGDKCKYATDFNWTDGHYQDGDTEIWYGVNIAEAKANKQDIVATITNRSGEQAHVHASIAFKCPYTDLQEMTRTLNPAQQVEKTLGYSTFSMMNTDGDMIWFLIETDQPIYFKAEMQPAERINDDACLTAIPFDWENGHVQEGGLETWYKMPLDTIRKAVKADMLPYLTVTNRGSVSCEYTAAVSTECPATVAYNERKQVVGALSSYEKLISVDMIRSISEDIDTLYVRVSGAQPLSFQIKMQKQNEGASCANPITFNWVTGNEQAKDNTVWYMVDMSDVKKTDKDVEFVLINKNSVAGSIDGELATVCPCLTTESSKISLKSKETKTKVVPHATVETFGDTVWIKLTSNIDIHFEAHAIDPEPFEPIEACKEAIELEYNHTYTITDTTWFYVLTDTVNHTPLVPEVKLTNGTTAQAIKAELAYHCPVTATMMEQSESFAAGTTKTKMLERTTAESMAREHDTIWVRLSASEMKAFTFRVTLIDPNDGKDCAHAMYVAPDTAIVQGAGKSLWYYIDREAIVAAGKGIEVVYHNQNATAGEAAMAAHNDCESGMLSVHNLTIGADAVVRDTISPFLLGAGSDRYMYLNFYTEQKDSIELNLYTPATIEAVDVCKTATPVIPNTDYKVAAGEKIWYSLNLTNLKENYEGDARMTMLNLNTTEAASVKGAMSWACEFDKQLQEKTYALTADGDYIEVIGRTTLEAIEQPMLYFYMTADKNVQFRIDMLISKGNDCGDGILFDWDNGNVHPADTALWYKVELDTVRIGAHDLRLHIDNKSDKETQATVSIYPDCLKEPLITSTYTFAANGGKYKDIDLDLIKYSGQEGNSWLLYYYSSQMTHIWVELIDEQPDSILTDTIQRTICAYEFFKDTVTGLDHYIDPDLRDSLTWNDTIQFQSGTYLVDSITTFIIRPIVDPDTSVFTTPELLSALPVLRQGMEVFTDTSVAILTRYYQEKGPKYEGDSVAPIESIHWEIAETFNLGTDVHTQYPTELESTINTINRLRCVITLGGECSKEIRSEEYDLPVLPWRTDSTVLRDTVCAGSLFEHTSGMDHYEWTINQDTLVRAEYKNKYVVDTLDQMRYIDSVYVYHLTVWKQQEIIGLETLAANAQPSAEIGKPIDNRLAHQSLNFQFDKEVNLETATMGVDTILWQAKINDGEFAEFADESLDCGDTLVNIRYAIVMNPCEDTIWSEPLVLHSKHRLTEANEEWQVLDTICPNDVLELPFSKYTYTDPGVYNDTIINENGCDTIVAHVLTRLMLYVPSFDEDSAYAVCGQPIVVDQISKAIADSVAQNPLLEARYTSLDWEVKIGEDAWKNLESDVLDARYDEITLRLTLHTECGDTAYEFQREIAPASAENVTEFNELPAETMFGDRMLMINLKEINATFNDSILAEEVHWYRILGSQDNIGFDNDNHPILVAADGDTQDSLVATGYYYTLPDAETLSGDYYALVARQFEIDPEDGTCGFAMRTKIIKTQVPQQAPATRKVVERGVVVIITEEEDRYDTNGRKF